MIRGAEDYLPLFLNRKAVAKIKTRFAQVCYLCNGLIKSITPLLKKLT
jgi:hypothetical protein